MKHKQIPEKTVERLVLYRHLLRDVLASGRETLYSHELAALAHNTPAQVRRDMMIIGYSGKSRKGYGASELIKCIGQILDESTETKIALVGIGNLGRAILSYFSTRQGALSVAAAFDSDETRTDRVIAGCRCFNVKDFKDKVKELGITVGVITVPAKYAQPTANMMIEAGIKGILNFAPAPVQVPEGVFCESIDISTTLEKIAYFGRTGKGTS